MVISDKLIKFAAGDIDLFKAFYDYWQHSRYNAGVTTAQFAKNDMNGNPISFAEKEALLNKALLQTIIRRSGVPYATESTVEQWFNHPVVRHETFAVVSALVDLILPEAVIESIGLYTDVLTIDYGDSARFEIKPRDLFVVSKAGHGQKTAEVKKQFNGQVTLVPEVHEITVGVSLYKVLSGKESLADFVAKAAKSIEVQMSLDAYNAFATALAALPSTATTGLQIAGYSQSGLTRLCEQVSAWNQGAKATIVGTRLALASVLPDDANYRYTLDSEYVKMGFIKNAFGFDVMMLPQVADFTTPWGLTLANDRLWVLSPSTQKLLKLAIEGNMLSNTTDTFQNADLTQTTTMWKNWAVGVATNATAGIMTL